MIRGNVMYHNVEWIEEMPCGDRISRYPKHLIGSVNNLCRVHGTGSCGCEVRFVTSAPQFTVRVQSFDGDGEIEVYYGDFFQGEYKIRSGEIKTIYLTKSVVSGDELRDDFYEGNAFSKNVVRVVMSKFFAIFCGVETFGYDCRPPQPDELPKKTIFAYGSSITHGASAHNRNLAYAPIAARLLGCDLINKGVGGACHAEPELADYFLDHPSWDAAILEIGINMQDCIPCDEIERRYRYFMEKAAATGKPIFAPSMYRCFGNYFKDSAKNETYNQVRAMIYRLQSELSYPNVHFLDGEDILPCSSLLSADGIHPSTEGHAVMGARLAEKMRPYL